VTILRLGRVVLIYSVIDFVRLIVPLFWYYWSIYRPVGFFISIERFFPCLSIGVDLFFHF